MARYYKDWLKSYVNYAGVTEAPKRMHFWSGVGAVAGALRRKVWLDMKRYTWYPSFYIIYVAPPGIVAKSTTADIAMDLLRQVPGIKFGPNAITWQALVTAFAGACENFEWPVGSHEYMPMSPLTLVASELGSLVNLQDRDMVNLLIELWDGKKSYDKITKMSGNDTVDAPWINLQACTTPHWLADNIPAATVGGGWPSRCVFIWADKKEKLVPYVDEQVGLDDAETRHHLIHDLEHIATSLVGAYQLSDATRVWGRHWYEEFWTKIQPTMDEQMVEAYAARKQTHLHKAAMVIAAAQRDSMTIELDDIELAAVMLGDLESDMPKVFARIGRSEESVQVERFLNLLRRRHEMRYDEAYRAIHNSFVDFREFESVLNGLIRTGYVNLQIRPDGHNWLVALKH